VFSSDAATLSIVVGYCASVWLLTVCASVDDSDKAAKRLPIETMPARRLSEIMAIKPSQLSKYGAMIDMLHRKNREGGPPCAAKFESRAFLASIGTTATLNWSAQCAAAP
jgi:hypothetical protein